MRLAMTMGVLGNLFIGKKTVQRKLALPTSNSDNSSRIHCEVMAWGFHEEAPDGRGRLAVNTSRQVGCGIDLQDVRPQTRNFGRHGHS